MLTHYSKLQESFPDVMLKQHDVIMQSSYWNSGKPFATQILTWSTWHLNYRPHAQEASALPLSYGGGLHW